MEGVTASCDGEGDRANVSSLNPDPQAGVRRRWLGRVLVAGGALGLVLALLFLVQGRKSHRYRMPDGATLEFLGISSGTNHVLPGRGWARPLTWLPAGWLTFTRLKSLAASARPMRTSAPMVVAYFKWKAHGALAAPGTQCAFALTTMDAAGFEVPCSWTPTGLPILAVPLESFARREAVLRLQPAALCPGPSLGGGGTWIPRRLDAIEVPNPARIDAPAWRPNPLPTSWREGRLEVVLDECRVEPSPRGAPQPVGLFEVNRAFARGRILEDGAPSKAWEPVSMEVSDAVGNRMALRIDPAGARFAGRAPGEFRHEFEWRLPSTESAWRVQYGIQRAQGSEWRPEEVSWLRGLRVPARDEITEVRQTRLVNGLAVEVLALVGDEAGLQDRPHDVMGQTILEVRCDKPLLDRALRLVVRVPDGREFEAAWARDLMSYGFEIPPGITQMDLRLGVFQRHVAEFLIGPEFVDVARAGKR